jgi:plastocyanin
MRRLAVAACAAALLLLAACGSSGSGATSTTTAGTSAQGPHITIKNFGYSGDLTVKPGAKVTVTNEDSTAHTLTDKKTHKFDTGNIDGNGGTGTFTAPTAPGKYPFGCTYHPEMKGTLTVQG